MTEQSRIQRYKTAIPVKFFGLNAITPVGEGTIVDLSKGGAKIYSAAHLPVKIVRAESLPTYSTGSYLAEVTYSGPALYPNMSEN